MNKEQLDLFGQDDFDLVSFINQKFPDEKSLSNIEDEISLVEQQIKILQLEITNEISDNHEQNKSIKEELKTSKGQIKQIIQDIKSLQQESINTEKTVEEMCKEIKILDSAKNNIQISINCLSKYSDLQQTLEQLKSSFQLKKFQEMNQLILCSQELSDFFKKYEEVPQINEILKQKEKLISHIQTMITDEFSLYFKNMSGLSKQQFNDACGIVETFGLKFKNKIQNIAINFVIDQYKEIFDTNSNNDLKAIDKRFIWFTKTLYEFKQKHLDLFPTYWGTTSFLINEFCCETSLQISYILNNLDIKDSNIVQLMKCFSNCTNFEKAMQNELSQEFQKIQSLGIKNQFQISQTPRILGSISNSFENYTQLYVNQEEKDLNERIQKEIQGDLANYLNIPINNQELNIFPSSITYFKLIKLLIERVQGISKGKTLLEISYVIQRSIVIFANLIQKFIQKEDEKTKREADGDKGLIQLIVLSINTFDHVKETVEKIYEVIDEVITEPFKQEVTLLNLEENIQILLIECISILNRRFSIKIDLFFQSNFVSIFNEEKYSQNQQQISIDKINSILNEFLNIIKQHTPKAYLIKLMKSYSETLNQKYFDNILKQKKINQQIFSILLQDFQEIKKLLSKLSEEFDIQNIYRNLNDQYCNQTEFKIQLLIDDMQIIKQKILQSQQIIDKQELRKILQFKGLKKNDIQSLLEEQQKFDKLKVKF